MRTFKFASVLLGILVLLGACTTTTSNEIQHLVIFNLPYLEDSVEARTFLEDGTRILTGIPVVKNFQAFQQVSEKNDYQYGFSMVFANQDDYDIYNKHPDHVAFVQERWLKEVTDFLEIDFKKP